MQREKRLINEGWRILLEKLVYVSWMFIKSTT